MASDLENEGGETDQKSHQTPGDLIELFEVLEWNKAVEDAKNGQ